MNTRKILGTAVALAALGAGVGVAFAKVDASTGDVVTSTEDD
jgi:hypothetical protein